MIAMIGQTKLNLWWLCLSIILALLPLLALLVGQQFDLWPLDSLAYRRFEIRALYAPFEVSFWNLLISATAFALSCIKGPHAQISRRIAKAAFISVGFAALASLSLCGGISLIGHL